MSKSRESLPEVPAHRSELADQVGNTLRADPPAPEVTPDSVDVPAFDPYSALGEMIASLPEGDRDAAAEYLMAHVIEPTGDVALKGADIVPPTPGTDAAPAPAAVVPLPKRVVATPVSPTPTPASSSPDRHGVSFVDPSDIEPASVATVTEIRPGVSAEPAVDNSHTLAERVAVAKRLIETAPAGKASFSERRLINGTSRDARTDERRRLRKGDRSMKEVEAVHRGYDSQERATNALAVAESARARTSRKLRVQRELAAKEQSVRDALTVDGVLNMKAYKARMKTMEKAIKKQVNLSTKRAVETARTQLDTAAEQLSAAEKAKKQAIKSRRWYKNTRMSTSNRRGYGVRSHAARPSPVRSIGSIPTIETEEERRRREARAA